MVGTGIPPLPVCGSLVSCQGGTGCFLTCAGLPASAGVPTQDAVPPVCDAVPPAREAVPAVAPAACRAVPSAACLRFVTSCRVPAKKRASNYSTEEMLNLLALINEHLPIDNSEWKLLWNSLVRWVMKVRKHELCN